MVLVRPCIQDDFMIVKEIIQEFYTEALEEFGLKYDNAQTNIVIETEYKQALVLEVDKVVVGLISGHLINDGMHASKIFQETIWYVKKEHRGYGKRLIKALEDRCKEQGLEAIMMGLMGNKMGDRVVLYYNRLGYKVLETLFIKEL